MKLDLSLSDPRTRRLLIIAGVILLVIIGVVIMIVRSRSKFAFPTSTSSGADKTLYDAIELCTTLYRQALASAKTDSDVPKSTCIKNAVDAYITSKCPFVSDSATYFSDLAKQTGPEWTAYQAYINTTASTPGSQYGVTTASNYVNAVVTGTSAPVISADIVKKARKADLTGPTRRYLATSCSGIYTPASGTDSVSSIYQGWTALQSGTPTAGTTTTYGFYNTLVTAPRILEWAIKAADMVTVSSAVSIAANASSAILSLTNPITTTTANTKITISGIGGMCTIQNIVTGVTSITVNFTAQTNAQTVAAGTPIYMNTQTTITTVTPLTGAGGATIGTPQTITSTAGTSLTAAAGTPFTGCTLAFAAGSLHSSIKTGSQVLLSGLSIPGNITVDNFPTSTSVKLLFDDLTTFPSFPVGQTLENVISIPYANPLLPSNVPLHVTAKVAAAGSASTTSPSITVNGAGTGITLNSTTVSLPTLGLPAAGNTIKVTASAPGPPQTYTLTNYNSGGTATAIQWPEIPVGTVILANPVAPATVGASIATTAANTTYNTVGKLNGTVMTLWQIAQTTGPGTFWPNFGSPAVAQPQYS